MLSAQVWGTVADWVGALSTGGAAISALAYYILDSRKSQAAQAGLVRASIHPDLDGIFEVSVTNDSDRPVTLEMLVQREKDFTQAALKGMPMQTRESYESESGWQHESELMRGDSEGVRFVADRKDQIMGFGHGRRTTYLRAALGDESCRLLPGRPLRFIAEYAIHRISTDYSLIFFDANAVAWELELRQPDGGPGQLKRARRRGPFKQLDGSRGGMRPVGYLRAAKRRVRNAIRLRWWLFQHRHEKTTPYPMFPVEAWRELMDTKREREQTPDQDSTS